MPISGFTTLQEAISATPIGGTLSIPAGVYIQERLTIPHTMRIVGDGAFMMSSPAYNDGGWGEAYHYGQSQGVVIVITATDGIGVDFTGVNPDGIYQSLHLENLVIVNANGASRTVTGLAISSSANKKGRCTLNNVLIGNFATGLKLDNLFVLSRFNVRVVGCQNIGIHALNSTVARFEADVISCGVGIKLEGGGNHSVTGTVQACGTGILSAGAVESTLETIYFEANSVFDLNLNINTQGFMINGCHFGSVSGIYIAGSHNTLISTNGLVGAIAITGNYNILIGKADSVNDEGWANSHSRMMTFTHNAKVYYFWSITANNPDGQPKGVLLPALWLQDSTGKPYEVVLDEIVELTLQS